MSRKRCPDYASMEPEDMEIADRVYVGGEEVCIWLAERTDYRIMRTDTGNPMPVYSESERRAWLDARQRAEGNRLKRRIR